MRWVDALFARATVTAVVGPSGSGKSSLLRILAGRDGEQQRLAFVQPTVGEPALIVADEPTAELDHASADCLLELPHRIADGGATVIVASHDPRITESADRVLALRHGAVETEHSEGRLLSVIAESSSLHPRGEPRVEFCGTP
ncbi:MAG: ABC transporter ATP-binding protein [Nitriliruptorales bacterium]